MKTTTSRNLNLLGYRMDCNEVERDEFRSDFVSSLRNIFLARFISGPLRFVAAVLATGSPLKLVT